MGFETARYCAEAAGGADGFSDALAAFREGLQAAADDMNRFGRSAQALCEASDAAGRRRQESLAGVAGTVRAAVGESGLAGALRENTRAVRANSDVVVACTDALESAFASGAAAGVTITE